MKTAVISFIKAILLAVSKVAMWACWLWAIVDFIMSIVNTDRSFNWSSVFWLIIMSITWIFFLVLHQSEEKEKKKESSKSNFQQRLEDAANKRKA